MPVLSDSLDDYIRSHMDAEHPYLHKLWRDSNIHLVHGHMISGHLQGCLLRMIVALLHPKNVLEIGTYTGYSTLCMASALSEGGRILTYEINDEMESFTRPRIEASPWADKIDFCIGDVLTDLPENYKQGKQKFDLIFMDGNKRQYLEYYRLCLSVLSSNGLLLADNTLWDGHIIDSAYDRDEQTLGIRRFNDFLARDQRISKVILPLRDGLTMIKFREEEKQ